mgnify:CR=1 FL=1
MISGISKKVIFFSFLFINFIQPSKSAELSKINKKTRALMIPHIYGFPCDMDKITKLCKKYKALLIIDEVQSGIGRTGSLFAYEKYKIKPDILCFAKGLANGLPIGGILTTHKISSRMNVGSHGTTFGGGPLVCAVGSKVLEIVSSKKYDCVTLWHVLEHTKDPVSILSFVKRVLNKDGRLVIALPNTDSYDNIYYGDKWAGYDVPRHQYHFNPKSINRLISTAGLEIESNKPLFFDAFYVSILSEKNSKSLFWFIKGCVIGLWSNIRALFNKKHSSIIYIVKL